MTSGARGPGGNDGSDDSEDDMVGGTIVQVVGDAVEVLDGTYFDRCWRKLAQPGAVRVGDSIWWQSYTGYLSRGDEFTDRNIGRCEPCNPHGQVSKVKIQ